MEKIDFQNLKSIIFGMFYYFKICDFTKDFTKDSLVKSLVKSQILEKIKNFEKMSISNFQNRFSPRKINIF